MIVSGYIAEGEFKGLRPGDEKILTHVNFAFAVVKEGRASVDHWKNSEKVREFIKNKGNIKALLSIGGWGAGGFSPACATPEGRELLAQTLVDIANDYGFDGVDLDWEYPCDDQAGIEASPDDKVNYTAWVQLLRDKLGNEKLVTMAAGGGQTIEGGYGYINCLELDKLTKIMDLFNIMTYDMCGWKESSYHTSLYLSKTCRNRAGADAIRQYLEAGVPASQLTLGAAFYGRVYSGTEGINTFTPGPPGFTGGYKDTMERAEKAGGVNYDEAAEAPWFHNNEDKTLVTFDNPRSLKAKVDFIKSENLAGIMFWEYSCDDENSTLLKSIEGELK